LDQGEHSSECGSGRRLGCDRHPLQHCEPLDIACRRQRETPRGRSNRSEPRGRRREEEEGACVSECLLLWLRRGALLLRLD